MKQLLEWSGMWTIAVGVVIAVAGIVVLIATDDSWILYATGWTIGLLGVLILFGSVLRDRLRERQTEDLDDVGFH